MMTNVLTEITANELLRRLLAGERDFASTRINAGQGDLAADPEFAALDEYLRGQDLRETPIVANGVDWRALRAPGLFFMGARLAGADFRGADLRDAEFRRADLSGAKFEGANVSGTNFIGARLMEADFSGATMIGTDLYEANISGGRLTDADLTGAFMLRLNLGSADLSGAKLTGVTFYRSDLRGAVGLDAVRDLGTCQFKHTIVTAHEQTIIEAALAALPRYDLRAE